MRKSFAPGKIILSGEYAVVFGFPGIAVPSTNGITARYTEDPSLGHVALSWDACSTDPRLALYTRKIIDLCQEQSPHLSGTLLVESNLPIAKGMGSSTALVIAIARALLGADCSNEAKNIEDTLTPQNSGLDFTVIWENEPVLFKKGTLSSRPSLSRNILTGAALIDTGEPCETTAELVDWVKYKKDSVQTHLETVGQCTQRILDGESLSSVLKDHHKAQLGLSVLTEEAKSLVGEIEKAGGAGKVIGAGGRTEGSGMVLAFGAKENLDSIARKHHMPIVFL